jgi:hypothetical protein
MSKLLTPQPLQLLSFDERIKLVSAAVQERIQNEQKANINHLRARLWVQWLKKNVIELEVQA